MQFHLFSCKTYHPLSSSFLKNVKGFETHETKYLSTAAYEKKAATLHSSICSVSHGIQWCIIEGKSKKGDLFFNHVYW